MTLDPDYNASLPHIGSRDHLSHLKSSIDRSHHIVRKYQAQRRSRVSTLRNVPRETASPDALPGGQSHYQRLCPVSTDV
jgi:hypothetical protein